MSGAVDIPGGTMTWLMEDAIHPGIGLSLAEMTVEPGKISELHSHSNCSEVIYLLEGRTRQRIGEEWLEMLAGDKCVIPKDTAHQTRNVGDKPAKMILAYSAGRREYEKL